MRIIFKSPDEIRLMRESGLVAASILINAWGVYWGVALGW